MIRFTMDRKEKRKKEEHTRTVCRHSAMAKKKTVPVVAHGREKKREGRPPRCVAVTSVGAEWKEGGKRSLKRLEYRSVAEERRGKKGGASLSLSTLLSLASALTLFDARLGGGK